MQFFNNFDKNVSRFFYKNLTFIALSFHSIDDKYVGLKTIKLIVEVVSYDGNRFSRIVCDFIDYYDHFWSGQIA
jgi:hypothetical protein